MPLLVQWPDGRCEALLFVIEEESDPRRFSIHRLAHYCLDLAELLETDRVVPVVIFLRGEANRRELALGGERHTYLRFRFLACELATLPYERYRDSDNIVARLNLPNMRYDRERKIDAYAQALRGFVGFEHDPEKQLKYIEFVDIYANLDDNERVRYERDYPDEAKTMSSFAERFRQQGIQRGKEEGKQEGEAVMLLRLLQLKFGDVPPAIRQEIERADAQTLLQWSERVLTVTRIEQVIGGNR